MLRSVISRLSTVRALVLPSTSSVRSMSSHGPVETDEEFDARYIAYLSRSDIDGWELRKAVNDLCGMDLVMDPKILIAALHACRRLNDYSATTRLLEAVQWSCGHHKDIWPYVLQEIKPTLNELGISTPAELGYDKPELHLESAHQL